MVQQNSKVFTDSEREKQNSTWQQIQLEKEKQEQPKQIGRERREEIANNSDLVSQINQQSNFEEAINEKLISLIKKNLLSNKFSGTSSSSQLIQIDEQDKEESQDEDIHSKLKELQFKKCKGERDYSQQMKRKIVLDILQYKSVNQKQFLKQVNAKAHELKIHIYLLKNWINAFEVIFKIEEEMSSQTRRSFSNEEMIEKIEKHFALYFQSNSSQKRYRLLKMASIIFEVLEISHLKSEKWLDQFLSKKKWSRKKNASSLISSSQKNENIVKRKSYKQKKPIKVENNSNPTMINFSLEIAIPKIILNDSDIEEQLKKHKPLKTEILKEKRLKKESYKKRKNSSSTQWSQNQYFPQQKIQFQYPLPFRENVAKRLDNIIEKNISSAIKAQAVQLCLEQKSLRRIYDQFGKYGIHIRAEQKKRNCSRLSSINGVNHSRNIRSAKSVKKNKQLTPSFYIKPCEKQYGNLEKLQLELIQFYKKNNFIKLEELERLSLNILAGLNNYDFHHQKERLQQWIDKTFKKYGIFLNSVEEC